MAIRMTTHQIRLNPTIEQEPYLKRAAGTRRLAYNWGPAEWHRQYAAYQVEQDAVPAEQRQLHPPNAMDLKKQFNAIRETEFPWTYDVTKCACEGAFFDLGDAFKRFFAGQTQYPKFKKKGKSHESFYLSNDKFTLGSHWIAIPGLGSFLTDQREQATGQPIKRLRKVQRALGTVNLAERLRFVDGSAPQPQKQRNARKQVRCQSVKIVGATVSYHAGWWYVSILVQIHVPDPPKQEAVVGIDAGLKTTATVSDGRVLENQKPLKSHLTKLCSGCGHKKKRMPEKHRTYICLHCGLVIDRDLNAARNLEAFAREMLRQLPV